MPLVAPFRGIRYNPEKIDNLAAVVAPPYDVISPEDQERYYARDPYNIVRLILGKEFPHDGVADSRYTRAARDFTAWKDQQILVRDPDPCLYLYESVFWHPDGRMHRRTGFMALVRLHEFSEGVIFPHERTFAKYKDDRLALMRACPANLSPVFAFYPDPLPSFRGAWEMERQRLPDIDLFNHDGIRHKLWVLRNPARIAAIRREIQDQPLFIADGHHRYETALAFRDELRGRDAGSPAERERRTYNYVLMTLVQARDPGLVILPTHRLIRGHGPFHLDGLLRQLDPHFAVESFRVDVDSGVEAIRPVLDAQRRRASQGNCIGLYGGGKEVYLLTLQDLALLRQIPLADRSPAVLDLDVTILHDLLIGRFLGMGDVHSMEGAIGYVQEPHRAIQEVEAGRARLAFLLNPTRIEQVQEVALARDRMPPKSTFFYPKLLTGLVMHPILPHETLDP